MMSKKGVGHVEAILSFIIFAGFLFFILIIFNPFSSQVDSELINSVFTNIQERTKSELSSISFNLNNTQSECLQVNISNLLSDMGCPLISPNNFNSTNIIVKNSSGSVISSDINLAGNRLYVGINNDKFYTIHCSNNITDVSSQSCSSNLLNEGYNFTLGQIVKRILWSELLLKDFEIQYNISYKTFKDKIITQGNDFEFIVWDLNSQTPIFKGEQLRRPRSTKIDSKTLGIDVLTNDSRILKRTITIRVW